MKFDSEGAGVKSTTGGIVSENSKNDLLVGSLRAQVLFRIRIEEGKLIEKERLLTKLGRIRDVEMGYDGFVYLLIEHNQAGSLVRIVPNN